MRHRHLPTPRYHRFRSSSDLIVASRLARNGMGRVTQLGDECIQRADTPAVHDDTRALSGVGVRNRAADAAAGPVTRAVRPESLMGILFFHA